MKQLCLIVFSLISFFSSAQNLLKDIVTSNASSHPRNMIDANGKQFFLAKGFNNSSNTELWVTNGTDAGTIRVKHPDNNVNLYISGSLCNIGDKVLFTAYTSQNNNSGYELWISDGTSGGTYMLKDINTSGSSYPGYFMQFGEKVIFWANDGINGNEPWVTDGTWNGTILLNDFNPGIAGSYPYSSNEFVINGSKLYFSVNTSNGGYELGVTNGTPGGTYIVKDIYEGSFSSYPTNFRVIGNKVIFTANNSTNGSELWTTDGTWEGTYLLKDIYEGAYGSYASGFTEINGKIVFKAEANSLGAELWITDGTTGGTKLLKDIYKNYSSSNPQDFTKAENFVFFSASDGISGRELWKTDGTTTGTIMVKDINQTSIFDENLTFSSYSFRKSFVNVNEKLFFLANSGSEGFELWSSDGTNAGTTIVKDILPGAASPEYINFQSLGSYLYFSVRDNNDKFYYYQTDGTDAGTIDISRANPELQFENVFNLTKVGNSFFYFAAYHPIAGYELFKADGNNISLVKDIETNPGYNYSDFSSKAGVSNNLFFNYNNNKNGNEIWISDGLSQTRILKDFIKYPSIWGSDYYSNSASISSMCTLNGYVYFILDSNIWRSNGETTEIVGATGSAQSALTVNNNKLRWIGWNQVFESDGNTINAVATMTDYNYYSSFILADVNGITYFTFNTATYGSELWRTDGTQEGTWMVKDISWGTNSTSFISAKKVGNKLFFGASNMNSGYELWVSDGTEGGTYMVKDIFPGSYSSYPNNLTMLNDNLLIFSASNGSNGKEIWRSDGTDWGTYMIADLYPGSSGSSPYSYEMGTFAVLNNKAYFSAYTPSGYQLFATDGNSMLTVKNGFSAEAIYVFKDQLYLRGLDYNSAYFGYELWKSDGTSEGTTLVKDIYSGSANSLPSRFYAQGDFLYFLADDGLHGQELWVLTPCADSLNIRTAVSGLNVYQAGKIIVGEEANTITSTANITYDAGKYVLLNPGFSTIAGAVFQTKLVGCGNNQSIPNSIISTRLDKKTEQYLQDMQEKPNIEDFIKKGNNPDLAIILSKYTEDSKPLSDKEYQLRFELEALEIQKSEAKSSSNNNYYAVKPEKERAYEMAKQEADRYKYFIAPVRNEQGAKLGYDLTIYAGGKVYQSSIRD